MKLKRKRLSCNASANQYAVDADSLSNKCLQMAHYPIGDGEISIKINKRAPPEQENTASKTSNNWYRPDLFIRTNDDPQTIFSTGTFSQRSCKSSGKSKMSRNRNKVMVLEGKNFNFNTTTGRTLSQARNPRPGSMTTTAKVQ